MNNLVREHRRPVEQFGDKAIREKRLRCFGHVQMRDWGTCSHGKWARDETA